MLEDDKQQDSFRRSPSTDKSLLDLEDCQVDGHIALSAGQKNRGNGESSGAAV